MVIIFDKAVDTNIIKIESTTITSGDKFYYQTETHHAWIIDYTTFKIRVGADDATITFSSIDSMTPYIEQFYSIFLFVNPFNGINNDVFYDKPKTGTIQQHTYVNTDIEQDLINKD